MPARPSRDPRGALTPHKPRNQGAIKPDELPALLRAIDGYPNIGDKQTALALRLLCLTRARRGYRAMRTGAARERSSAKEGMVVSLSSGRVSHVVLEFHRAWNPDSKLAAMPMKALKRAVEKAGEKVERAVDRPRRQR